MPKAQTTNVLQISDLMLSCYLFVPTVAQAALDVWQYKMQVITITKQAWNLRGRLLKFQKSKSWVTMGKLWVQSIKVIM